MKKLMLLAAFALVAGSIAHADCHSQSPKPMTSAKENQRKALYVSALIDTHSSVGANTSGTSAKAVR